MNYEINSLKCLAFVRFDRVVGSAKPMSQSN